MPIGLCHWQHINKENHNVTNGHLNTFKHVNIQSIKHLSSIKLKINYFVLSLIIV